MIFRSKTQSQFLLQIETLAKKVLESPAVVVTPDHIADAQAAAAVLIAKRTAQKRSRQRLEKEADRLIKKAETRTHPTALLAQLVLAPILSPAASIKIRQREARSILAHLRQPIFDLGAAPRRRRKILIKIDI